MAVRVTMRRRCDMPVESADDARRKAEPTSDWFPTSTSPRARGDLAAQARRQMRAATRI